MRLTVFDRAGLLTHGAVLALGLGGLVGAVPLPRGRRFGFGLVLMAVSMVVLLFAARRPPAGLAPALVHVVTIALALWLLIGPLVPGALRSPVRSGSHFNHGNRS